MGKRTRKKRQNNNKNNSPQHSKNKPSSDSNANDTNSSVLLQRIRHADPRTRHAALAAVANTLLDTSRTTPPKISTTLLQAIRERVMDADLDVCQVAAGCLANYVTLVAALDQVTPTQSMTAGWTLVLIGRLKQCQEHFLAQTNATPNNSNKSSSKKKAAPPTSIAKMQKQWLALAVQCLRTLCVLMETNPEAVGRLTSSMDATPRRDFHQTLLEWMQQSQHYYTNASATKEEEALQGFYQQILTLAARTLHSAWDDNADLLVPFQQESPDAFQNGMKLLETIIQPSNSNLPVVAQLHCMGAYLTARSFGNKTQDVLQNTILPQLSQQLSKFSWTMAQSLLQSYQQVSEKWEQEQADDALEKDVIRKVEERKEPARQIARRQKALKDAAKAEQDKKDEKMQDDAAKKDDSAMEAEDQHQQQQVETQQALEQAREAWNQFLLPLQLSLELLANLTSSASVQEDDDDNDAMMMDEDDWGPDQEAQWMQHQQQQEQGQQSQSAQQNDLHKLLIESPLPQQLHQLSQHVYQIPQGMVFPEQSREDVQDLQSKTMACLGNCWETMTASWPIAVSWAQLQQAATTATGSGQEGLVSAMVIALRTFSKVRKEWQPEHVTFWLNQLNNTTATSPTVRRDIITMLGILCSQEAHPVEVNQKICTALLSALTNESESVLIPCEVLNVLMDMYGNDDQDDGCCHVSVFESLEVLRHFQRSIPTLKSKLRQQERTCDNKAEVEQWKETLLNASRFVQYKKGQL